MFCAAVLRQTRSSNAYIVYSDLRGDVLKNYRRDVAERERIYEDKSILSPRFTPITERPVSFHRSANLTWAPDVIMNGTPVELLCYHACGGELTYVGLEPALELFSQSGAAGLSDFSKTFRIGGEDCVPLRELCDLLGVEVTYDPDYDTIEIRTGP